MKTKTEKDVDIWLQEDEANGIADCGCLLMAEFQGDDHGHNGCPAFWFCPLHRAAADLFKALREARQKWGRLHDIISDLVESDKINEAVLPDDYEAIVQALLRGTDAEAHAVDALNEAKPPKIDEPNWFA